MDYDILHQFAMISMGSSRSSCYLRVCSAECAVVGRASKQSRVVARTKRQSPAEDLSRRCVWAAIRETRWYALIRDSVWLVSATPLIDFQPQKSSAQPQPTLKHQFDDKSCERHNCCQSIPRPQIVHATISTSKVARNGPDQ